MENLQIFKNEEFGEIRTVTINNEPWFVGKDIATTLDYSEPHKAVSRHVEEEDRMKHPILTKGGIQESWLINESGLYSLILSSKLPNAKKFKRWVTSDVLPSIRKHGVYAVDELLNNPDMAIKAFEALRDEREKNKQLTQTVAVQNQQILELQPKASYYDLVLNCKDLMSISTIAKDYGKSAQWMNKYLHDKKVQYKQGEIWLLYQKYAEKGYTGTKTNDYLRADGTNGTKVHTYWTQKGRLFIYDLMKGDNYLPLIEKE